MIKSQQSTLNKTFDILHSSFLLVAAASILHIIYNTSVIKFSWSMLFIIFIGVRIFLYSGIYGLIVDLTLGKYFRISLKGLLENAKKYWMICLLLSIFQFYANKFILLFINEYNLRPNFEIYFFDLAVLFFISFYIIYDKNLKNADFKLKSIIIKKRHIILLIFIYVFDAFTMNLFHLFPFDRRYLTNELVVLSVYFHLFIFCYLVIFILSLVSSKKKESYDKELFLVCPIAGGVLTGIASRFISAYPPFFVVLKALTPKYYRFKEFIRVPWKERFYEKNKLVAISSYTSNSPESYKIAKEFKKRGSTVVMGGPHVSNLPDEALTFCDSVVIGEAESIWAEVIKDYEDGTLKKKYYGVPLDNFHDIVHQELLNSPDYIIRECIETTRGCKYNCDFCTISSMTGNKLRKIPITDIVELISKLPPNKRSFMILDNNIYSDPGYAKEFFKAIIPLKTKWGTQCSLDIAQNEEALNLAKQSGCMQFLFGYEILGGSSEEKKCGKFSFVKKYAQFSRRTKKAGIAIKAHFIYGFDSDNIFSMLKTLKFCFLIRPFITSISMLTPLPGSRLFKEMIKENRITNYNWRNYSLHSRVFKHKILNDTLFEILFPVLKYTAFLTTCVVGQTIILILLIDGIFFQFKHFLF